MRGNEVCLSVWPCGAVGSASTTTGLRGGRAGCAKDEEVQETCWWRSFGIVTWFLLIAWLTMGVIKLAVDAGMGPRVKERQQKEKWPILQGGVLHLVGKEVGGREADLKTRGGWHLERWTGKERAKRELEAGKGKGKARKEEGKRRRGGRWRRGKLYGKKKAINCRLNGSSYGQQKPEKSWCARLKSWTSDWWSLKQERAARARLHDYARRRRSWRGASRWPVEEQNGPCSSAGKEREGN